MADTKEEPAGKVHFDNILNFRDVGIFANSHAGSKLLLEGQLFRCARPDNASPRDREKLSQKCRIRTVIDLRTTSEHIKEAQNRDAQIHSSVITGQSNETAAEPLKIPGLQYREINLNGKGFERNLLWQLSWSSLSKLITLMALGYRTQAISIMGREVLQPRGLHGLARDMLDHSKPEIRQIFAILEEPQNYPIMIHCTQGKDRTGLIIALILFLLDVPLETITRDYRLSEAELLPEKDARMVEIREIGLDESFAGCPIDWVDGVKSYVDETYGGVRQYLEQQLDIGPEKQRRIIEALSAGLYEHGKPQSK